MIGKSKRRHTVRYQVFFFRCVLQILHWAFVWVANSKLCFIHFGIMYANPCLEAQHDLATCLFSNFTCTLHILLHETSNAYVLLMGGLILYDSTMSL